MIGACVLSPDGGWNWLQLILWLVALPFVSAALFVLAAFMAMIFRRRRGLFYNLFLWLAISVNINVLTSSAAFRNGSIQSSG